MWPLETEARTIGVLRIPKYFRSLSLFWRQSTTQPGLSQRRIVAYLISRRCHKSLLLQSQKNTGNGVGVESTPSATLSLATTSIPSVHWGPIWRPLTTLHRIPRYRASKRRSIKRKSRIALRITSFDVSKRSWPASSFMYLQAYDLVQDNYKMGSRCEAASSTFSPPPKQLVVQLG
jgi:hypothetical protein